MNDDNLTPEEQQLVSQLAKREVEALPDDMLQRFHDAIDSAAKIERGRNRDKSGSLHFMSFFWGAAVTAALALGVGIGVWIAGDQGSTTTTLTAGDPQNGPGVEAVPVAFQRSIQNYLRQSEREISVLPIDAEADRVLLIARIIEQNRWFEKAAAQNNSDDLARVLRAFEPILVRLAADDITPEEAEALRAKLSFELNVMLTKLAYETSEEQEITEEST